MFEITPAVVVLVVVGGFLGGIASGAAGFAYGVVATSIWLHAISPVHAALLVVSGGAINQCGLVWTMRRTLEPGRLWPFLVGGLIGVPLGVELVLDSNPHVIRNGLAAFMIAYGLFTLAAPKLPHVVWGGRAADAFVGFLGGLLGGVAGLSGIFPAMWTQIRGWSKTTSRGVYQPFILLAHVLTLLLIGAVALDRDGVILFLIALPAILLGSWTGWMIYGKLDDRRFRQVLSGLLIASGILLIF
jgi:hypothetical protein